MISDKNI